MTRNARILELTFAFAIIAFFVGLSTAVAGTTAQPRHYGDELFSDRFLVEQIGVVIMTAAIVVLLVAGFLRLLLYLKSPTYPADRCDDISSHLNNTNSKQNKCQG